VPVQPLEKLDDIAIAPHPPGKTGEIAEGGLGIRLGARVLYPPVGAIRIGPVCFDGHDVEGFAVDERLRQLRTRVVELVRAV
jgi:hypothetical protein